MTIDLNKFSFDDCRSALAGKRVLITGAGKHGGLGQAMAFASAMAGAESVGVHFRGSYSDGLETVEAINAAGGNAFPVQADVTNTSDVWATRSHVIRRMGGKPPNLLICNSGLSESGYLLGRAPREKEGERPAMRRARARQAFITNLADSTRVVNTKVDGFLYLTHLWAGEALHFGESLQILYISSRQAVEPGAGVPGYVLANFGVLALPQILRVNLGRKGSQVTSSCLALPFVRTAMTQAYADNPKVFGRWQPRMLEPEEFARAFLSLLAHPAQTLNGKLVQLDVSADPSAGEGGITTQWSEVQMQPVTTPLV
ncbi:MAG: SDR family oxidoreductase [Myxococcales bacterium]|nr:SDR family oxidoreductase [Myxococcales bacterium]